MIIPDANILIYAFNASSPFHKKAAFWWEEAVNAGAPIGVPWIVLMAFVRLLSSRAVVPDPYPPHELFAITDEWFEFKHILLLEPTQTTYALFRDVMISLVLPGTLSTDALIAATAREHQGVVYTNDTDFARFPNVKTKNPLVTPKTRP